MMSRTMCSYCCRVKLQKYACFQDHIGVARMGEPGGRKVGHEFEHTLTFWGKNCTTRRSFISSI
jgi:hypothetical protein